MKPIEGLNNLNPIKPASGLGGLDRLQKPGKPGEFQEALNAFKDKAGVGSTDAVGGLSFSNHAVDRMRSRGIHFDAATLQGIEKAVGKAAAKGSSNTLVLTENAALVVSAKNNKVVTALDKAMMKENVFTNIDSTVLV